MHWNNELSPQEEQAFQRWCQACPEHSQAWHQVQCASRDFESANDSPPYCSRQCRHIQSKRCKMLDLLGLVPTEVTTSAHPGSPQVAPLKRHVSRMIGKWKS